jgi:hypothetical protein
MRWSSVDFRAVKYFVQDCEDGYTFLKTHRRHNTKKEPEYKLWTLINNIVSILALQL